MSSIELKEKLIDKIRQTNDQVLLDELSALMELQEPEAIYLLTDHQKKAITEAREQIAKGDYLSNEQADKEVDEWLNQ